MPDFAGICIGAWLICMVINFFLGLAAMAGVKSIDGKLGCSHYIGVAISMICGPFGTLYYIAGIITAENSSNHMDF